MNSSCTDHVLLFVQDYSDVDRVELISRGNIRVVDVDANIKDLGDSNAASTTVAFNGLAPPKASGIPWWIYLIGIVVALVVLIIIVVILWKVRTSA